MFHFNVQIERGKKKNPIWDFLLIVFMVALLYIITNLVMPFIVAYWQNITLH